MKIGIVSDTHGSQATLLRALALLGEQGIDTVLHCGDIDDPATIGLFVGRTAHFVFGNNDWDREVLEAAIREIGGTAHDPFGSLELEGVKIGFLHGDDLMLLRDLEQSRHFDFLFHGHTHQVSEKVVGNTRVINPGALYRAKPKTFATLDLETREVKILVVG